MMAKMELRFIVFLSFFALFVSDEAAGFVNLSFEHGQRVFPPDQFEDPGRPPVSLALPGWTFSLGDEDQDTIFYNSFPLDGGVFLLTNSGAYSGRYSLILEAGFEDARISQVGRIASNVSTLEFSLYEPTSLDLGMLRVAVDGETVEFASLGEVERSGRIWTRVGADISGHTGQEVEIAIGTIDRTIFAPEPFFGFWIDDISFSRREVVIPEPGILSLLLVSVLSFKFMRRRL